MEEIKLIGIALPHKTSNENNQSTKDCGNLWQKFEKESYLNKIPGKVDNTLYAVYHKYEGDFSQPFYYFIGAAVNPGTKVPKELESLLIPAGNYRKFIAHGQMPNCIASTWQEVWNQDIPRAYSVDFEVYDERSHDRSNAEVDIYISLK